ncbi:DUF421 domain-containing protein [Paenibacillus gansuensis]|uniref:DUF421 domain-containing protein n=1 Tax=Paenibacillus gansuensis TaxID=306542 RepID=A0ABW5PDT7_9BACL
MSDEVSILVRSLGAVFFLFVLTRVLGKKQISQLTFFEYITGIALGELVGIMSTDLERVFYHGLISLAVWGFVPLAVEFISLRSKTVRNVLEGQGTVFIRNGNILEKNLKKERYSTDELLEQLRKKGVFQAADVEFAVLEPSGELTVLPTKENLPLTAKMLGIPMLSEQEPQTVMMDGAILKDTLKPRGLTEAWLKDEMDKRKIREEDVYLAQVDAKNRLYFDMKGVQIHRPEPEKPDLQNQMLTHLTQSAILMERYLADAEDSPMANSMSELRDRARQVISQLQPAAVNSTKESR